MVNKILQEEETLIESHRTHIDVMMELIKRQMRELNEVDRPGSHIAEYCRNLDDILNQQVQKISEFRVKVDEFRGYLQREEILSRNMAAARSNF